ncbi:daptomycin-sensing surface protein LiaX [Carnobacterium sp. FSL W8-0810]|uniref:daptomycin-sensing surface protein LiaX n=2 Tax=Carnobacterium TaxID=2747 RepID=UPI0030FA2D5F
MKQRERILELVKQGIISTEEALVLLENAAKKEGKEAIKKEQTHAQNEEHKPTPPIPPKKPEEAHHEEPSHDPEFPNPEEEDQDEVLSKEEQKDREQLEKILESLSNEASTYSVKIDEKNLEIATIKSKLRLVQEKLMVLETKEDLDELDSEKMPEMNRMKNEIDELKAQLEDLEEDKTELEDHLKTIKRKQWGTQKKQISEKFEIPEDWKETANETLNQVTGKVVDTGNQFGKFMKETFSTVMENMDWKDVNVRVPGLASTKFTHEFHYPESSASIIDVKVANGNVLFKNWDSQDIKIEADIKIYGKLDTVTPLEAFQKRSTVEVTDEKMLFHVPNKRIRCDLVFYLPERMYDYTAINLLNGNVKFEEFEGKDFYVKCTNGNVFFQDLTATMLETDGVNGTVTVLDSTVRDLMVKSVNGGIVTRGNIKSGNLSTVNGTVKVSLEGDDLTRMDASSVNGSVKVSFPKNYSVEGEAKSNLGTIQHRIDHLETLKERKDRTSQLLEFRRVADTQLLVLKLETTTGNILLKEAE